jgi:Na+-driven multidrug efflux pump
MDRTVIGEYFRARRWAGSALVMLAITMLWFVISVQLFGVLHIPLSYAARGAAPPWSIRYMQIIGYFCLLSAAIDLVGLIRDKRKTLAWMVLAACILSFAALGAASE